MARAYALLVLLMAAGCGGDDDSGSTDHVAPPRTCFPPEGQDGFPETVEEVVAHIEAMPKPVTVPCFLQSLARPLEIDATSNTFSLQPAVGPNNPRIFVFRGPLLLSVVPKGEGRPLVELAVMRGAARSLKAEIAFPIEEELTEAAPYERIREDVGTNCAFCHFNEVRDPDITHADAFISDVVPREEKYRLDMDYLDWVFRNCDPESEPDRGAMLDAVFGYGDVVQGPTH